MVFGLSASAWSAWVQDWTTDEPVHLDWSRRLLDTGITERTSSLHYNSKTPVVMLNVIGRRVARRWLGIDDQTALRFAARTATLVWLALLLATLYVFTERLGGPVAACLAAALAALDPNLIAHGGLATVDVAFALATLWVPAAALALLRRPSLVHGALLGLALGFAFVVKFTAFLLPPLLLLLLVVRPWRPAPPPRARTLVPALAVAAAVAVLVVCAGYLFRGLAVPLGTVTWKTPALAWLSRSLPGLALPLPIDFLTGLDVSLNAERSKDWPVAILGEPRRGSVWYYFALLWLVKNPLAALAAIGFGLWLLMRSGRLRVDAPLRALALVAAVLLLYFSLVFRAKLGYRYALMIVPLACVLAGAGLAPMLAHSRAIPAAAVLAAAAAAEQVPYLGNHLAFSNALVLPKREAWRVLADSNLDWGQNDARVAEWLARRGPPAPRLSPPHLVVGENVLSVQDLVFGPHGWVRENLRPAAHFRHTYLLFHLGEADYQRLLDQSRRLEPQAATASECAGRALEPLTAEGALRPMSAQAEHVLCLRAEGMADVGVEATAGVALVGPRDRPRRLRDHLRPGHAAWYRLVPGTHALVLTQAAGFEGRLHARGAPVRWSLKRP